MTIQTRLENGAEMIVVAQLRELNFAVTMS